MSCLRLIKTWLVDDSSCFFFPRMRVSVVFCLFALAAIISAQDFEVKYVIDAFETQTDTIVILIPGGGVAPGDDPIVEDRFISGNDIMGGERDVRLTVGSGDGNLVLSTGVSNGQYTAATPNEARGNSLLQLDGPDQSMTLVPNGLFSSPNNDFTARGGNALRVLMESDLPGTVIFRVISGTFTNVCQESVSLPGDDTQNEYILPFDEFDTQNCNFANVGAIEIFILMDDNVDVNIEDFSVWGPVQSCICDCPAFSCFLYYDLDDDVFSYYRTSDFGVFNPTTDFSTLYTPGNTNSFTPVDTTNLSTFFTTFDTSFTSLPSFFTSFTSFSSFSSNSFSFSGSSSSSGAAGLTATFAVVAFATAALF